MQGPYFIIIIIIIINLYWYDMHTLNPIKSERQWGSHASTYAVLGLHTHKTIQSLSCKKPVKSTDSKLRLKAFRVSLQNILTGK